MRLLSFLTPLVVVALLTPSFAQSQDVPDFKVTGVATVNSSGVENPFYLLRMPVIQEIAYAALGGALSGQYLESKLSGSGVTIDNLVSTDILKPVSRGRYALAMNVVTKDDKKLLRKIAAPAGESLAAAFLEKRTEFSEIFDQYDLSSVDRDLLTMAMIGCVILDWDGLGVTADRGYRAVATKRADGSWYHMTMHEDVKTLSVRALYWGSNGTPLKNGIVVSTFGDQEHGNRLGFPDIKNLTNSEDIKRKAPLPLARALSSIYYNAMLDQEDAAAEIMIALRGGKANKKSIVKKLGLDEEVTARTLRLLEAMYYIEENDGEYIARIPVFTSKNDEKMTQEVRALGQQIISNWLAVNYDDIKGDLMDLSAVKAGVDYDIVFVQVWHDLFAWANYHLVQSGYLYDPYGPNAEFVSFVPFVWERSMNLWENSQKTK